MLVGVLPSHTRDTPMDMLDLHIDINCTWAIHRRKIYNEMIMKNIIIQKYKDKEHYIINQLGMYIPEINHRHYF